MEVTIDKNSGFCFGVVNAIRKAEEILSGEGTLYCLGDIVHNEKEVERLILLGLKIISREKFNTLHDCKVLIRAHGEPPETYRTAYRNNIELIDGTCPVVLKLQDRIELSYNEIKSSNGQVVIYGKKGHAEVEGLSGQANHLAIIIESPGDLDKLDYTRPIHLYSQTTQDKKIYAQIESEIKHRIESTGGKAESFKCSHSICGQVTNRAPRLIEFSRTHDVIIFVSGKKSSNGKFLYGECKLVNPNSYFVSDIEDIQKNWFENAGKIGVCGATSTPQWLMVKVAEFIRQLKESD
ncbi:MAG: 4-hydroxy-3-methylbut-2-enyl diphosphate reductase [Bacteroidales bacterium]|nr:4-hydroxy-3-methylbut-2-enyl diphosphate reductase [Bacteroidales bacterium]